MIGSLRAYSRHRKVTLRAVQKAIASGRISLLADGRVDFAAADAAWPANSRPVNGGGPAPRSLAAAQAEVQRLRAALLAHELAVRRGDYVRRDAVERDAFSFGRASRDRVLLIGPRLLPTLLPMLLADERETAQRLVEDELRATCEDMAGLAEGGRGFSASPRAEVAT